MTSSTVDPAVFKDSCNRWRTQSLFKETCTDPGKYPPLFLLYDEDDKDGLVSMKRVYMEAADPTEYGAAMAMFGCWEPWANLCNVQFFQKEVNKWRKELAIKIRSEATRTIKAMSTGGVKASGTQFSAAKWMAEQGWLNYTKTPAGGPNAHELSSEGGDPSSTPRTAGRPSKAAVSAEAEAKLRDMLKRHEMAEEDAKRIGVL